MFTSTLPDVEIPDVSLYESLFANLTEEDAGVVALIDAASGAETTYGELRAHINAFAGALAARGLVVGDVVGLLSPNIPAFATAFHGALRAGATVTTINALYTAEDIAKQLTDAKASWLITVSPLLPQAKAAATQVGIADDHLIVLDGADGHPNLRGLLSEQQTPPEVQFDPSTHLAVLPYSSGTTGLPKGVMLTHRNLVANVQQARAVLGLNPGDKIMAVLPFFHIYGMTALLNLSLQQRATLVTMPRFDLEQFLGAIQKYAVTYVFIAPPIAVALAKHPLVAQYDISSVRVLFSGAAPLDGDTAELAASRIGAVIRQGYGLTETSPVTHANPPARNDFPASSIGILIPNVEMKLVDSETGAEIDAEYGDDGYTAAGEIWVRGPNIMVGYLGREDATAESIDADGFFHTGDVGVAHRDGFFRVVDRLKELIKYKGYQIPPAELEALLLGHAEIADAAVIGVTDGDGNEIPKAFVVLAAQSSLSEDDVMSYVAEHVSPFKKVRAVEFIDAIPKSAAGKILRKDLRAKEAVASSTT